MTHGLASYRPRNDGKNPRVPIANQKMLECPPRPSDDLGVTYPWVENLSKEGPCREEAIERLHDLMLRAARFELSRRRGALSHVRGEELDDIAMQAANDALMAVLGKLDDFRGASRFTTWAYKFALLEAGVKLRRRAWQSREVVLDDDAWAAFAGGGSTVHEELERHEHSATCGRPWTS